MKYFACAFFAIVVPSIAIADECGGGVCVAKISSATVWEEGLELSVDIGEVESECTLEDNQTIFGIIRRTYGDVVYDDIFRIVELAIQNGEMVSIEYEIREGGLCTVTAIGVLPR